ncbi:hypothetical protein FRC10_009331 [Ceratobasidium sp. 414]|nr:hypothetical protein FRC10_009331 [Ceratobasidium sp. 414]
MSLNSELEDSNGVEQHVEAANLAQARTQHLVGRFKLHVHQLLPHNKQRLLNQDWVKQLAEKMKGCLDRHLHPIEVLLAPDGNILQLKEAQASAGDSLPTAPKSTRFLVFNGQHRVAALNTMRLRPEDLWWDALVYQNALETDRPAEFLSIMHQANDEENKMYTVDSSRFIGVHQLNNLRTKGLIDENIWAANRSVMLGKNQSVRTAIGALTKDQTVSDAISAALDWPVIYHCFKASSWRKLISGRYYQVVAGLVQEMTVQVELLSNGKKELPVEPFDLSARLCTLTDLKEKIAKSKGSHPWDALPGGAKEALRRFTTYQPNFKTALYPKCTTKWTFENMVLLPSSLTGKFVLGEIEILNVVGQHLIRMIGSDEHYSSVTTRNQTSQDAQPAGVIKLVLGARNTPTGIPNYEQRILEELWINRNKLHSELVQHHIPTPSTASGADYIALLDKSEPWWSILRLFKMRTFPFGFRLSCSSTFAGSTSETEPATAVKVEFASPSGCSTQSEVTPSPDIRKRKHQGDFQSSEPKKEAKRWTTKDDQHDGQDMGLRDTEQVARNASPTGRESMLKDLPAVDDGTLSDTESAKENAPRSSKTKAGRQAAELLVVRESEDDYDMIQDLMAESNHDISQELGSEGTDD